MIVTDLDGTLLTSTNKLSKKNEQTIKDLRDKGIPVVVATGRILYSVQEVLDEDFPIDYLIFSSGAGILDFAKMEMLFASGMNRETVMNTISILEENKLNYMIHAPVPENEYCLYKLDGQFKNKDLAQRLSIYEDFSTAWSGQIPENEEFESSASLILTSVPAEVGEEIFETLKKLLLGVHVVRTTSPLDDNYNWIEILPENVSKAKASQWLKNYLNNNKNYNIDQVMAVGNDFNDLDLLSWANHSFVVQNAPEILRNSFKEVSSNDNHGFSEAVEIFQNRES